MKYSKYFGLDFFFSHVFYPVPLTVRAATYLRLRSQTYWVKNLGSGVRLPGTESISATHEVFDLENLFYHSTPQFPYFYRRDNNGTYPIEFLWGLKELIQIKTLGHYLAHNELQKGAIITIQIFLKVVFES